METTIRKVKLLKSGPANKTTFVLGATGCGKTTLIANLLMDNERFVIFDAKNDYQTEFFGADCIAVENCKDFAFHLNEGKKRIIFRLHSLDVESDETLDCALQFLCLFQRNNLHFVECAISIDELNRFAQTNTWPKYLKELIERGRDYKVVKVFGAQWFNKIPPEMRDSFSEIYVFRHSEKVALARLEDYGFDSDELKTLPVHHCLHVGKNGFERIHLSPLAMRQAEQLTPEKMES